MVANDALGYVYLAVCPPLLSASPGFSLSFCHANRLYLFDFILPWILNCSRQKKKNPLSKGWFLTQTRPFIITCGITGLMNDYSVTLILYLSLTEALSEKENILNAILKSTEKNHCSYKIPASSQRNLKMKWFLHSKMKACCDSEFCDRFS